jgi:hypothetical protein
MIKPRNNMKVTEPEMNPRKANHDMFLKYQKKSIFSIPIATTPAAEPIINMLPPVPAEKAMKCHKGLSIGSENIPILAATKGTLSITADPIPNNMITISVLGIAVLSVSAKPNSIPKDSRAATASKIPKKKRILGNSIFDSDL